MKTHIFVQLKDLTKHPALDTIIENAKKELARNYSSYRKGCRTSEELFCFYVPIPCHLPSVCPFAGTEIATFNYIWGSVLKDSQYACFMNDYNAYKNNEANLSSQPSPWLKKYHAVEYLNDYPSLSCRRLDVPSAKDEASSDEKILFFKLADLLHYSPEEQWFTPIPDDLDYPKISPILHFYHDGGYVWVLTPFTSDSGVIEDPKIGEEYSFTSTDGSITAKMKGERMYHNTLECRGYIEDYTEKNYDTLMTFNKNKDNDEYYLSYFFSWRRRHMDTLEKMNRWKEFWNWINSEFTGSPAYRKKQTNAYLQVLSEMISEATEQDMNEIFKVLVNAQKKC